MENARTSNYLKRLRGPPAHDIHVTSKGHGMQNIKDKVVVITGASSGLGEAVARSLVKNGAKLVLGARRICHEPAR